MPYWFEPTSVSVEIGGRTMTIETGKIAKQAAALAHDLEQSTSRMMILRVRLEMLLESCDSLREEGDLNFRGTRIAFAALPRTDNFRLLCCRDQLSKLL